MSRPSAQHLRLPCGLVSVALSPASSNPPSAAARSRIEGRLAHPKPSDSICSPGLARLIVLASAKHGPSRSLSLLSSALAAAKIFRASCESLSRCTFAPYSIHPPLLVASALFLLIVFCPPPRVPDHYYFLRNVLPAVKSLDLATALHLLLIFTSLVPLHPRRVDSLCAGASDIWPLRYTSLRYSHKAFIKAFSASWHDRIPLISISPLRRKTAVPLYHCFRFHSITALVPPGHRRIFFDFGTFISVTGVWTTLSTSSPGTRTSRGSRSAILFY